MKLKIKKTREKILKDSQKLKYASLVGGNAFENQIGRAHV